MKRSLLILLPLTCYAKNVTSDYEYDDQILSKNKDGGTMAWISLGLGVLGSWWGLESYLDNDDPNCAFDRVLPDGKLDSDEINLLKGMVMAKQCGCLTRGASRSIDELLKELGRRYKQFIRDNRNLKYDGYDNSCWDFRYCRGVAKGIQQGYFANGNFHLEERICQLLNPNTKSLVSRGGHKVTALKYLYCPNWSVPIPCTERWQGKGDFFKMSLSNYCPYETWTVSSSSPGGSYLFNNRFKTFLAVHVQAYIKVQYDVIIAKYGKTGVYKSGDNSRCISRRCMMSRRDINRKLGCHRVRWDWTRYA